LLCFLTGATYLQSSGAEAECIAFMRSQLGADNAFRTYKFAAEVAASAGMQAAAEEYIQAIFGPVLRLFSRTGSSSLSVKEFLGTAREEWESVVSADVQVCEELLCYALVGWIEHDLDARQDDN
jgi:hypothetical protein